LRDLTEASAFFVIRVKYNLASKRLCSDHADRSAGLTSADRKGTDNEKSSFSPDEGSHD
jgi:hypothetical protein